MRAARGIHWVVSYRWPCRTKPRNRPLGRVLEGFLELPVLVVLGAMQLVGGALLGGRKHLIHSTS
jgi:hypothetical protein